VDVTLRAGPKVWDDVAVCSIPTRDDHPVDVVERGVQGKIVYPAQQGQGQR